MEGNITHTAITSYGYGTLRLKKGPNLPGPIFPTLPIFSYYFFISIIIPFGILLYIRPNFFIFATHIRDPISRLTFATPFRDSHSRPPFATHIRDPISRLTFATTLATTLHGSRSQPHSRLSFATPDRAPNRDSLFFCCDFRRATPPLTDGLC